MSAEPTPNPAFAVDANGIPIESWGGKFERKFKENPFVPVLAGLTTVSLIVAGAKLRRRDSASLNNWLRVRVLMQGLTIVAVVGGSWWYGQMKHQKEAANAAEQERVLQRAGFEARLRAAEEADKLEKLEAQVHASAGAQGGVKGGWFGGWFGKGGPSGGAGADGSSASKGAGPSA
ncbi:uncharacterized protein TRAVEDRAFT_133981 [Trametes versicolor FP-101664 SS1]|uniref:uncharacterized protein n=1 Tax=Trametes versicolor (strain FP-101664) TaxID=717944 RepID=UPI0004623FBE|nr:uncharacterized protein TRAVEDRAFT_133981 [Trametes versicolor FP-101664 SS1]EIW53410.1 hypothetical protein TRAVEDRAFT_133981 [Trametes versicolor FP-101664 SS1]